MLDTLHIILCCKIQPRIIPTMRKSIYLLLDTSKSILCCKIQPRIITTMRSSISLLLDTSKSILNCKIQPRIITTMRKSIYLTLSENTYTVQYHHIKKSNCTKNTKLVLHSLHCIWDSRLESYI